VKQWITRNLGEICDEVGGTIRTGPFGSQLHQSDYQDEGVPVVMPKDIVEGRVSTDEIARIGGSDAVRLSQHKLQVGDIVYGRRGDIGRRALITELEAGWICGTGCLRISMGNSVLDSTYLYYYLGESKITTWIYNQAIGATLPNLNTSIIRSIPITYPRLSIQHKIASILSAYDDLIENNTRRIQILEEMAQRLYREWFVNFRFPGHEQTKLVESELGLIPEGWGVSRLRDVCKKISYGYTASANSKSVGPKFLRITDIVPYLIDWDRVPYCEIPAEKLNKYKLEEGDIVIARTGATTGYAKRLNKRHPQSVFASYLVRIRVDQSLAKSNYIGIIVESNAYKDFIRANLSGAAQPQANAQVLTSFLILLPPQEIQSQFDSLVSALSDKREILQQKNLNLRQTRDLLLPKLISGEIDVEQLDVDTEEIAA
jgi:type I restriction enzyme, S subunit